MEFQNNSILASELPPQERKRRSYGLPGKLRAGRTGPSFFQPDALLPQQFLDVYQRRASLDPEKELMLAVLQDGIACFQKYVRAQDRKGKNRFREAEDWIMEENSDRVFSFENICEILAIDASSPKRAAAVEEKDACGSRSKKRKADSTQEEVRSK
jgi:hypothetical protein